MPSSGGTSTSTGMARVRAAASFTQMDLHLSLDVALELIHADREALKRVETFAGYPGPCGHRVRDTIEEIFILLLRAMGERHISPGFERCLLMKLCVTVLRKTPANWLHLTEPQSRCARTNPLSMTRQQVWHH